MNYNLLNNQRILLSFLLRNWKRKAGILSVMSGAGNGLKLSQTSAEYPRGNTL